MPSSQLILIYCANISWALFSNDSTPWSISCFSPQGSDKLSLSLTERDKLNIFTKRGDGGLKYIKYIRPDIKWYTNDLRNARFFFISYPLTTMSHVFNMQLRSTDFLEFKLFFSKQNSSFDKLKSCWLEKQFKQAVYKFWGSSNDCILGPRQIGGQITQLRLPAEILCCFPKERRVYRRHHYFAWQL